MWRNGTVADLAARTHRFLVTRGADGADEWRGRHVQRTPVFQVRIRASSALPLRCAALLCSAVSEVPRTLLLACLSPLSCRPTLHAQVDAVLDTNGAGDTFATAYMLAAAAGHRSPITAAHQAAGLAVSQPQACKPACVTTALRSGWTCCPSHAWAPLQRLVLPPVRHVGRLLGLAVPIGGCSMA